MSAHTLDALPAWEDGTVAVLSTGGGAPHAIPISTCVRAGDRAVLLALALRRESLARLRTDPRAALTFLARDIACTALGTVVVAREPMMISDRVAAVRLDVDELQDHRQPLFAMESAVAWRWTDDEARERDAEIRSELRALAAGPRSSGP
ncbi:MAG: hypothetical protein QOF26_591 [Baekduia sp.]|nr:hypothetical protein [Baekduia sp.]